MQALFLLITVAVLLAILAADIATAILDPRHAGARVTVPLGRRPVEPAGATVGSGPPDEAPAQRRGRPLARGRAQPQGHGRARRCCCSSSCWPRSRG